MVCDHNIATVIMYGQNCHYEGYGYLKIADCAGTKYYNYIFCLM